MAKEARINAILKSLRLEIVNTRSDTQRFREALDSMRYGLPEIPCGPYLLSQEEIERIEEIKATGLIVDKAISYPVHMDVDRQRGFVYINNDVHDKKYPLRVYLGQEWVDKFIKPLHACPLIETPSSFAIVPHPWQLKGAAQMHYLCLSSLKGAICGDAMGLGKTMIAILLMELARRERGTFSVYVCPASCRENVKTAILAAYKGEHQPRVLVLTDSRMTAHALAEGKWDIVICSYHFLSIQYKAKEKYKSYFDKYRRGAGPVPARPVASLLDEFWELRDLPIKRLIVDECQVIKKDTGSFYKAIKSMYCRATALFFGTLLFNRWPDIANAVTLLKGQPFETYRDFVRTFASPGENRSHDKSDPDIPSIQRFFFVPLGTLFFCTLIGEAVVSAFIFNLIL